MPHTAPALDPLRLGRLEELRQAQGVADVADTAEPILGGMMSFTGPGSWTNQACGLAMDAPATEAEIDRLVRFYTDRGHEPRVELAPFAHPTLIAGLAARGFSLLEFETVMARALPSAEPPAALPPQGVTIRLVRPDDATEVDTWVRTSNSGFVRPGDPGESMFNESSRRVAVHPRVVCFLAESAGQPIGAGAVELARPTGEETIACLIATSVLPEHRRRGVQQALMAARLIAARERGASFAFVHARPGIATERNARRLGFQTLYTKAVMVLRRPDLIRSL